jgi:YD repeat-containing protein
MIAYGNRCEDEEINSSYRHCRRKTMDMIYFGLLLKTNCTSIRKILLVVVVCGLTSGVFAQTDGIRYFYDDAGQLTKIADPSGDVAAYSYDAAGNLLQIKRSSVAANALAILNIEPRQGGVGSTVTLQGQGFSVTAAQNAVAINGAPATVVSATSNALVVTVPVGATTGPVSVTVSNQTATSDINFRVIQPPNILAINPRFIVETASTNTITNFSVTGLNLDRSAFSFLPVLSPPAITVNTAAVDRPGTSATLSISIGANISGAFTLLATSNGGSSSQGSTAANTLHILDANRDDDNDGLTNAVEIALGTDPLNPSTANDGIPDGYALFFGLNPSNPSGASQTAPDGLTYLQAFQQGLNPLVPSLAPPAVAKVFPADGTTNYPTNSVVVVRFNEPLQSPVTLAAAQSAINASLPAGSNFSSANAAIAAQVLQAFLLRTCCSGTLAVPGTVQLLQGGRPVAGTIALSNDGLSLVFAPTQPLSSSTTYTVLVQGVKAASGIQMAGTFQSSFTTGLTTDLTTGTLVRNSPANGATDVPTNAAFMVEFNKQVDPSSLTPQTFFITDGVTEQNVPGILQVDSSGFTASFVPQTQYAVGRRFFVELSGVLDLSENRFPFASFFFTTGFGPATQGPSLVATSPASGVTGVPINSLVVAQFSEPLSVINAMTGFQVLQGSTPILGAIALSNGNTQLTFTPVSPLAPNTNYTIAATSQITDVAENPLTNPSNFTFTTGAAADNTTPVVTTVSPANFAEGVPTNSVIQLQFSKPVDPLTVTTAAFEVFPPAFLAAPAPGTVSVSADGLTATFTPNPPLDPSTNYFIEFNRGIADPQGHALLLNSSHFTTGVGPATTAPTVLQVNPPSGASGAPVNPQVAVVVSAPVRAASVSNSAITVSAGGTAAGGTISLSSDRTTLTFTPTNLLATSTIYTVTASGFTDQAGNAVTPFTSSFSTGTSGVANTNHPTVTAVSPANQATGVATNSAIVLTFSEAINAATVNVNTVQILASGFGGQLAGSYSVDATGQVVTFTPASPLPGNNLILVVVNGVADLSGNDNNFFESSFTTVTGTDTTAPQVVMVTPGSGATAIGLNATVVLSFSKSLNRSTVNSNTVGLLANGNKISGGIGISADNRMVGLGGFFPASSTVTVVATPGITDLAGNALPNFESSFTTAAAFDTDHPAVVTQRPGNGATGVPLNTSVVLYVNDAMNPATVPGALHVSQNGVLVSGTTQVTDSGQVVVFTPSAQWANNALIQVFLDATALDVKGNTLSAYQGSFSTIPDTSTVAPSVVSLSPGLFASGVPTNVVIDIGFNEALDPATVSPTAINLMQGFFCCNSPVIPSTLSLINGGTVVQITPNVPLAANTFYFVQINSGLQGTNGLATRFDLVNFETGAGTDTVAPAILSVSPPNGSVNVGDNAQIRVVFSKPVNPLTVNGKTIQLTGGGATAIADAINFSNNSVVLVPHAPLPDNTAMTLTISGVTGLTGDPVAPQTTTFTTGTGPDVVAPVVVNGNPFLGASNVGVNAPIMLQTSKPIDPGTVNSSTLLIQHQLTPDFQNPQQVVGNYSVSPDGQTISFLPTTPLAVSSTFSISFANRGITDLSGNLLSGAGLSFLGFRTGTAANTTGPSVTGVSPANGLAGVPINSQVVVQFSEPVDELTINQVTLSGGGETVNVISRLSNANQMLTLIPVVPLNTNTTYTVSVTGIKDLSGNALTAPSTTTFTTGATADLTLPSVTTASPADGAVGVPTKSVIQLQFNKRVNPLTVAFGVFPLSNFNFVQGTIAVSADGLTATFTPNAALSPSTSYSVNATGLDLEGQSLFLSSSFTTGTQ